MSVLTDDQIKEIARQVATANNVGFTGITLTPAIESAGDAAIETVFSLTSGSSAAIMGAQSAHTISEVVRN